MADFNAVGGVDNGVNAIPSSVAVDPSAAATAVALPPRTPHGGASMVPASPANPAAAAEAVVVELPMDDDVVASDQQQQQRQLREQQRRAAARRSFTAAESRWELKRKIASISSDLELLAQEVRLLTREGAEFCCFFLPLFLFFVLLLTFSLLRCLSST